MSTGETTNLHLTKPARGAEKQTWGEPTLNNNFDIIDDAIGDRTYTEGNYILDDEPLASSIDKLDVKLHEVATTTAGATGPSGPSGPMGPSGPAGGLAITRKIILAPEYAGAVLWDGGVVPTAGAMTSDFEFDSVGWGYNFYKWTSSVVPEGPPEIYNIVVRWKLPETFDGFNDSTNQALIIDILTEDTGTDAYLGVTIFKDDPSGSPSEITPIASTVADTWYSERAGNEVLAFDATDSVLSILAAGDVLVIMIAMSSRDSKYVKVGDITIQYTG